MLPFTKRPGRGDDAKDVITKDDLENPPYGADAPTSSLKRSFPPSRGPLESVSDEEMTRLLATSALGGPVLPAAGRPPPGVGSALPAPTPPPPRSRSVPPPSVRPPPSQRAVYDDDDDDDEGRTVVRGMAPRIIKRVSGKTLGPLTAPTSISPTAVIKATLESARPPRENLLPGPPRDLLEDASDFAETASAHPGLGAARSQAPLFEGPPAHRAAFPAPVSSRPHAAYGDPRSAVPPAPGSHRAGEGYGLPSPAVSSVPAAMPSVPAHFMTPQARAEDPPGTAVTSRHRVAGRPALSWAMALLGCGLLVGVGAVAAVQSNESVAETTAAFVDPSRAVAHAGVPNAAVPNMALAQPSAPAGNAAPADAPSPSQGAPTGVPPAADPSQPPAGVIGASPVAVAPPPVATEAAPAAEEAVAATPVVTTPAAPAEPAASEPAASEPAAKPKPKAAAPKPAPRPAAAPKPAPRPAAKPVAKDVPRRRPAARAPAAVSDTDEETRKALEALQKAQLESASSFGGD